MGNTYNHDCNYCRYYQTNNTLELDKLREQSRDKLNADIKRRKEFDDKLHDELEPKLSEFLQLRDNYLNSDLLDYIAKEKRKQKRNNSF